MCATNPSMGVLQGQKGLQDITIAGKYSFLERTSSKLGMLRAIAVLSGGFPLSAYTPDFLPSRSAPRASISMDV